MKNSNKNIKNRKRTLSVIVIVLAIASLAYRLISNFDIEQTSILFVGLPALITLLLINYSGTPKTAYGVVFKTITLFLLISAILFGEGLICILMAAPIFYGVAALLVFISEYLKRKKRSKLYTIVIAPILLVSLQLNTISSKPPVHIIENSIIVENNCNLENFNRSPDFQAHLPLFFKIGFPKPLSIEGRGISNNDTRTIYFESSTKGLAPLILKVNRISENNISFIPVKDETHISHWLTWKEMNVQFVPIDKNKTKITWTTQFTCDLGPDWYFEPWEKFAVSKMNDLLLKTYFQPTNFDK